MDCKMISDRLKNVILKELKLDEYDIQDETLATRFRDGTR
jgi:hypothetical protein